MPPLRCMHKLYGGRVGERGWISGQCCGASSSYEYVCPSGTLGPMVFLSTWER